MRPMPHQYKIVKQSKSNNFRNNIYIYNRYDSSSEESVVRGDMLWWWNYDNQKIDVPVSAAVSVVAEEHGV